MRVLGLMLLLACGHEAAPGESVAEVCNAENAGRSVAVSGYLVAPVVTLGCTETCSLDLSDERGKRDTTIELRFDVGRTVRTMDAIEMESEYPIEGQVERLYPSDFVLRTDDMEEVNPGDVVRVEGELQHGSVFGCSIRPTSVKKL